MAVEITHDSPDNYGSPPSLKAYVEEEIERRLVMMLSFLPAVKSGETADSIRLMRVWARRTRAALECSKSCFPVKELSKIEEALKLVAFSLGESRDMDVLASALEKRGEALPEDQRAGIAEMISDLKSQRIAKQKSVVKSVIKFEKLNLLALFRNLRESPPSTTASHAIHPKETPSHG